jgi:hypothetical protein
MSCCKNKCKCDYPCVIPVPKSTELKTIALLELSGPGINTYDGNLKLTFEYYFKNSKQFKPFPIVDTTSTLDKTLELLEYYYIAGYRIFIGFSRSSILASVKAWFDSHPLAIGISPNSTSPTLDIPKNIYRLSPSDSNILTNIKLSPFILQRRYIFYIYSKGEVATETVLTLLQSSPIGSKIIPIPINSDSSNINDIQTIYLANNYNPATDAAIDYLYVGTQRQDFIKQFSITFTPVPSFDISLSSFPIFKDTEKIVWSNIYGNFYYAFQNINISTSPLWRQGYNTLTPYVYNTIGLDALQLNNFLKTKTSIQELSNYSFVQEFDQYKDTIYFSYSDFNYSFNQTTLEEKWNPDSVFVKDPIFGTFYQVLS